MGMEIQSNEIGSYALLWISYRHVRIFIPYKECLSTVFLRLHDFVSPNTNLRIA